MKGGMQNWSLHMMRLIDYAATYHPEQEIVTRNDDGTMDRATWSSVAGRSRKLAAALVALGIMPGDRVATLAWNTRRHLESWFGIMGAGAISHTVNPRLFDEQIAYICNDASDRLLFLDVSFVPILERIAPLIPCLENYILLCSRDAMPDSALPLKSIDDLIDSHEPNDWVPVDEGDAAGLCYTSGTTGKPKGVLYEHRANVLHAYAAASPDGFNISSRTTILPIVPMYHANAWGLPFVAAATGAKLVLNGTTNDPATILEMIRGEGVTLAAGVPTIWRGVLDIIDRDGGGLDQLQELLIGGAPAPGSLIDRFEDELDIRVTHAWGMTELSPIGTVGRPSAAVAKLSPQERRRIQFKQGRPLFGIEMILRDDEGNDVAHDGASRGHLLVRGAWVVSRYFNSDHVATDQDGWFDTGDISTIDGYGYMQIVDRAKDLIKSGGEWISSVELENATLQMSDVADVAAIGIPHPKWDERPLLIVVVKAGCDLPAASVLDHLSTQVAKWWLPERIVFADSIIRTATGKIDKVAMRKKYVHLAEFETIAQ
jgi:acyl-CoA synthetase (AMP-forming)/AMP-acid ligase II